MIGFLLHALALVILVGAILIIVAGLSHSSSGEPNFWVWYAFCWCSAIVFIIFGGLFIGLGWVIGWALIEVFS